MTYSINDDLSYMAKIADKIKQELHEIQHLTISLSDHEGLQRNATNLTNIAYTIHLMAENLKSKYEAPLPEIDLKAIANNNLIQKLRHFKGHEQ